jgi:hypothetical protein
MIASASCDYVNRLARELHEMFLAVSDIVSNEVEVSECISAEPTPLWPASECAVDKRPNEVKEEEHRSTASFDTWVSRPQEENI